MYWSKIVGASSETQTPNVCESISLQLIGYIILHSDTHAASSSIHHGMYKLGNWIGLQVNPMQHEQEHSFVGIDIIITTLIKLMIRNKSIVVECIFL
jgi:hypothetical protein